MNEVLQSDIFFFVTTAVVIVVGILLIVAIGYVIKILRDVKKGIDYVKEGSVVVREEAKVFIEKVKTEKNLIKKIGALIFAAIGWKAKRAVRRTKGKISKD